MVDVSSSKDGSICVLLMHASDQPFLVMGLPLYMNYYAVHDHENGQLGFAPHKDTKKLNLIDLN